MKTVFITGCNRGLGLAILKKYVADGYNVIACIRKFNQEFSDLCVALMKAHSVDIQILYCDMEIPEEVEQLTAKLETMDGEIDVLINNAGINVMKPLLYVEPSDLQETFQVNYFAPVLLTKAIANKMIRDGKGVIVNITSMGSLGHQSGGVCYDASKSALNQFTISIARELAPFDIRVNAVACGPMNTDMFAGIAEKGQKNLIKTTALGRVAEPEEIAEVVYLLTTEQTSYVTGQIIRVDGGAIL